MGEEEEEVTLDEMVVAGAVVAVDREEAVVGGTVGEGVNATSIYSANNITKKQCFSYPFISNKTNEQMRIISHPPSSS